MARGERSIQRRVRTLVGGRVVGTGPALQTPLPSTLWGDMHENLGNSAVSALVVEGPADASGLYLADVLAASARTGEDFRAFLPWRASAEWSRFALAWYRVLWAERERHALANPALEGPDVGANTAGAASAPEPGLDVAAAGPAEGASLDGSALDGDTFELDGAAIAGGTVARTARGPDITDPVAMNAWFDTLDRQTGAGRLLTPDETGLLEAVHGRPIPDARIHEGAFARDMAAQINARAFTVGSDVWMGEDVDLADPRGAELLAHEITHVIQNALGRGASSSSGPVSSPGDSHEREAEAKGKEAAVLVSHGGWDFQAPDGLDGRGRYLSNVIAGQLPAGAPPAPASLLQEGLRELLAARAEARIAAAMAELSSLDAEDVAVQDALVQLEDARAAVSDAGTDAGSLAALLGLGGRPTGAELQGLQSGFAPYPSFAAQAAAFLAALPTLDGALGPAPAVAPAVETTDVEALFRVGNVADIDPARAIHTAALVDRLAQALRLPSGAVHVRTDAAAAERLAAVGTHGLFEGGEVLLDPAAYDPTTMEGRSLLAHEVTHVAQGALPAYDGASAAGLDSGVMAEAEAHLAASAFAAGGEIQPLMMGLPEGHVAADGDISGDSLNQCLDAYRIEADSTRGTMTPPPGVTDTSKSSASQNRRKKVSQYKDGVDGIADQIGDLDAFDDLCDSVDEASDHEAENAAAKKENKATKDAPAKANPNGPLARVKASEPYKKLCRMWQSAKEGGEDAEEMQAAFTNEFDGRGFWGSTEKAFDLVELNAKRDAKPEPGAESAKATAADAKKKLGEEVDGKGTKDGGKANAGDKGSKVDAGGIPADLQALMGAPVEDTVPTIGSFETMHGVTDDAFNGLVGKTQEFSGFQAAAASGPGATSRTAQIGSALFTNFGNAFVGGFTDQAIDSLVWDNLGKLGDKGMAALTKGAVGGKGAPFIGPILGLGKEVFAAWGPDGLDWGKLGGSATGFNKGADAMASFGQIGETLGNLNNCHSTKDVIGVLFAAAADLFQGLRDLAEGLATLCGTLSALCYIVGGILILVGIATAWLGWGVALMQAGAWLVKAGTLLARINTALGLLVIFLSGMTVFFRTIAAFTVPAELYAKQLEGVGSSAEHFGQKAGEKSADKTAEKIKGSLPKPKADANAESKNPGGEPKGEAVQKKADSDIDAQNKRLEDASKQLDDEKARIQADKDAAAAKEKEKNKAKNEDDPDSGKTKESAGKRALKVLDSLTQFSEIRDGVKELGGHLKKGPTGGSDMHTIDPGDRQVAVDKLDARLQKQQAKVEELKAALEAAKSKGLPDAEIKKIQDKVNKQIKSLEAEKASVEKLKADFDKAKAIEDAIAEENRVKEENKKKKKNGDPLEESPIEKEISGKKDAVAAHDETVKKAQAEFDKAKKDGDQRTAELEANIKKAKEDAKKLRDEVGDEAAAKKEIDDHERKFQDDQAKKSSDVLDKMKTLTTEADALNKQAGDAEKAKTLREAATKAEAQVAKTQKNLTAAMNTLDQHVGKTVVLDGGVNGRRTRDANVLAVTANGLVVTDGKGGTKTVPFSEVFGPQGIKNAAVRADTESKKLTELQATIDEGKKADTLAPPDANAEQLRQQADAKRLEAQNLQPDWDAAQSASAPPHAKQAKLNDATGLEGKAADLQKQLDQVKAGVNEKSTRLDDAKKDLGKAQQDLRDVETKKETMASTADSNDSLRKASSGNATGGVGSSFKFWGEGLVRVIANFDKLLATWKETGVTAGSITAVIAEPEAGEGPKSIGEAVASKIPFLQKQSADALNKIGKKQEAIERLLALPPPVDVVAMEAKRKKAGETHLKYQAAHASALKAFKAEQVVEQLSVETKKLASAGKPIETASKSMTAPLATSKNDENQRTAVITGQDPNAPKQEGAGGIVATLVAKLASSSDGMDEQPSANGESGANIDKGAEKGKKDSKDNHDRAKRMSEQQRMFLDQAIAARAAQEQHVTSNIQKLDAKYAEEQAIKQEIQLMKAQALSEREQHRAVVEENAAGFNADHEQLAAWAIDFDTRTQGVAEAGGS